MAMRRLSLIMVALVTVACSGNAPSAGGNPIGTSPDAASVKAAIMAANSKFLDAFKRGDTAGMSASYADDAVLMMPNEGAWRGRAAIDQGLSSFVDQMSFKDGANVTTDVMVGGDLAVETGTYAWTLQPKTGAEITDKGKYLTIWKRQADGSWKIVRDINNTDLPAKM